MPTYPVLKGPTDLLVVKQGTLNERETADGVVYTLTLIGTQDAFYSLSFLPRGTELYDVGPNWGVPAGYYIDERTFKQILNGPEFTSSCYEMDLVCRSADNMGDGIVDTAEPDIYELDWEVAQVPLKNHSARYVPTTMTSFVGSSNKTVWGFIQDWLNAPDTNRQAAVYQEMMATATDDAQKLTFSDFIVMYIRGVEAREVFYPVLTRTYITNTAPAGTGTPGQIVSSLPTGFNAIKPTGTWTYRQMPDKITRIGRTQSVKVVRRYVGDPAWDSRLYGTTAEQQDNYQTLG